MVPAAFWEFQKPQLTKHVHFPGLEFVYQRYGAPDIPWHVHTVCCALVRSHAFSLNWKLLARAVALFWLHLDSSAYSGVKKPQHELLSPLFA